MSKTFLYPDKKRIFTTKISSNFNFTLASWFLGNVHENPFQHTGPPPPYIVNVVFCVRKFWIIKIANRTTYIQLLCVHACIECARNDGNNFLSVFLSVRMMSVQKWQGCYLELHYSHTCLISTDIGLCLLLSGCKNISLTHFCCFL